MSVKSIERAFDILELLSQEPNGLNLKTIGERLDLHKSTVHRLLAVLNQRGYVEKTEQRGRYRIGLGFVDLAGMHLNSLELTTEAQPYLRHLSKQTGQTAFLAVMEGRDVVYIDKVESYNSLRRYRIIGRRRPLHATSLGKSLLAGLSQEQITRLYEGVELNRLTENTITDLSVLLAEVRMCRKRGWSYDNEENELGTRCVGAPIYDYREKVIAALSVAWEAPVNPELDADQVCEYVKEAAFGVSVRMGYRPHDPQRRHLSP
jgi:DNA-binding IclR family transcriptional regulator